MPGKDTADDELSGLPPGSIVRRKIRGAYRFYHQWREDGRTRSRYLKPDEVLPLRRQIERRKALLRRADRSDEAKVRGVFAADPPPPPLGDALTGRMLHEFALGAERFTPRRMLPDVLDFLRRDASDRALLLDGHAGTGRTTLMRHAALAMTDEEREATAYVRLCDSVQPDALNAALAALRRQGVRRVLVDGLADFGALGGTGLKIVASGRDRGPFDDRPAAPPRFIAVDCAFIPYAEHTALTGETGINGYLEHGGVLDPSAAQGGPAGDTARLMTDIFLREALDVPEKPRDTRRRREAFVANDLQKMLRALDGAAADAGDGLDTLRERLLPVAPAARMRAIRARVRELMDDASFRGLGAAERKLVRDAAMDAVSTRLAEDVVWRELVATRASDSTDVERVRFAPGAYGIVVADAAELSCEVRVVAAGGARDDFQLRHLNDPLRIEDLGHRYGFVTAREVLYEGRDARHPSGVSYRNIEKFLLGLR